VVALALAHMKYLSDAVNQLLDKAILGSMTKGKNATSLFSMTVVELQVFKLPDKAEIFFILNIIQFLICNYCFTVLLVNFSKFILLFFLE
jgi:hypothetical protein